jgi:hypothetical protein|tara:strand:- start:920 stop:1120 length:201 start_codon:yes stop_codon:yes gene_type:complete
MRGVVIQIEEETWSKLVELSRLLFRGHRGASTKNRRIRKKYVTRTLIIVLEGIREEVRSYGSSDVG